MAGVNASYPAEATERIRTGNSSGPGVRMHFKSPMTKNVNSENPIEKNVSHFLVTFFWREGGREGEWRIEFAVILSIMRRIQLSICDELSLCRF